MSRSRLLDPVAGKVLDTREIGSPPPYPVLAFSPDGTQLAIGGNGRALLLDLNDGAVHSVALPKLRVTENGQIDKPFGWAGTRYFYADQQLHDPSFPLPLWDYRGAEAMQFRGYQLWACVRPPGSSTVTLRAFVLPHIDAQQYVTKAKATAEMFVLKPGSGIRLDLSGIPLDQQNEVKASLEVRLKEIGYTPDANAAAILYASIDTTGTKGSVSSVNGATVTYTRRPAMLRLVLSGKELWSESWSVTPPFFLKLESGEMPEQYFDRIGVGEPNYTLFKKAPLPSYFPGSSAPQGTFGASDFTPDGIRDSSQK